MGDTKFWRGAAVVTLAALVVAGCQSGDDAGERPKQGAEASAGSGRDADVDPSLAVPGFQVGEIPPVPLFVLPDLSLLSSLNDAFTLKFASIDGDYPGLTVAPVGCDADGRRTTSDGGVLAYGDGSTDYYGPDSTIHNYGDGSGDYYGPDVTVHNYGDGSGDYYGPDTTIHVYKDRSGDYYGPNLTIHLYANGSGDYYDGDTTIHVYKNGSGDYYAPGITIHNYGDGSGDYYGPGITIHNYGKGTAEVIADGPTVTVPADPLPKVPPLGKFPPMEALAPQESCGVSITLDAGLLFDFGKYDIRADAAEVINTVAQALKDNDVPAATVEGHTDSISDDAFNQTLSENRAKAVTDALKSAGASTNLTATGYGKTRPVAPNTNPDGSDNPAGRQLNRRVEIFIPTF